MKLLIIFLFFSIYTNLYSQSDYQHWEWAKSFGGQGDDITSDIKVKNGFVYVTGTFTSQTINWGNTTLTNNGNRDVFVAKLDTNGNTIWVKSFGGTADDSVRQLEINNNGVFALLCKSASGNINFGSVQLNNPTNFYVKFDTDGNLLKAQALPDSLTYNDIDIGNDGSIYAACNYYHEFTFANTLVDTLRPSQPPLYAPVVFIDSSYYYVNPQDIVYYSSGSAILKYDTAGDESWVKVFHAVPQELFIAFDNTNNVVVALFQAKSAIDFGGVWYEYYGSFFAPASLFFAGISPGSEIIYTKNSFGAVSFINCLGFDNNGLGFLSFSTHTYGYIYDPSQLSSFRNGQIQRSISDFPNYSKNINVGENGHTMLNNYFYNNNIFILDSSLKMSDSIIVPDGGGKLLLHRRNMSGQALYFGDNFSGDSLVLKNDSIPSLPSFNLYNQGGNDIFIGKFHSPGFLPLSFNVFKDTFKFCYGNTNIDLDSSTVIKNSGAGSLTYHWQPSADFNNPNILNTSVNMTADTIVGTLTVTDAAGNSISKNIVFYNGIQSDVHLKLSDTIVCSKVNVSLSLTGSLFDICYVQDNCSRNKFPFDSLNKINYYYVDCPGIDTFKLSSESLKYCFDTTPVKLQINPTYNIYNSISVCAGASYTFPDDTTITNITQNYRRIRYLHTTKGCDSTTVTDLIVITTPQTQTENILICAGSNYTFPDSTTQNNIQTNTSHKSILKATGGCDSVYIYTNITVNPVYSNTNNINVCAGSIFIFPDSTVINNIQTDLTHTSHLSTISGCDSSITTNLHVIIIDSSITKTGATLYANLNNATYQWFDCISNTLIPNETGQSFTASLIGDYAVQLQKDGCIDTSSCYTISYNDLINHGKADINIYPVPAGNILTIKFISEVQTTLNTHLYNELGKPVLSNRFNLVPGTNEIALNVSSLQKGVYILILFNNYKQEKIIKKIVID